MAQSSGVNVVDCCRVYPPPGSTSPTTIPLTFLDIPWLFFPSSKALFFYEYPHSTSHFMSVTLPVLTRSLSLALQRFFPFAGNLVVNLKAGCSKPSIDYCDGDYVSLTVAESSGNFDHLTGNYAREINDFYPYVPALAAKIRGDMQMVLLFSVQVTVFSLCGFCIGLAYHHAVADGRTFNNFIKAWASLCKDSSCISSSPSYDRTVIKDANGLESIFLKELWKRKSSQGILVDARETLVYLQNMVRATFVISLKAMEKIKDRIIAQCKQKNTPQPVHLSAYVLTCAVVWVSLLKSQTQTGQDVNDHPSEDPIHFGFIAGGMTRFQFPVPTTYFGNYVGFGRCGAMRNELIGDDGIIVAANVLGDAIRVLDKDILGGAEKWISDWEVLFGSKVHVVVHGSPKLDLYETDFGWGRPKKIEDISVNGMRGISLVESKNEKGGIEVGLTLPKDQMDAFNSLLNEYNILQ